jgi:lysophospholipase L1-like esterase
MAIRDWDIVTSYVDSVTTTLKTVTFPKVQEQVKVKNQGNANITYTIGSQSGTLTPGQSVTVNEDISSFTVQAVSGTHTFEVRANEKGTEQTTSEAAVGYNIKHLDSFKQLLKTNSNSGIINISVAADSIGEGQGATNELDNGFVSIMNDTIQSIYGKAGKGMVSARRYTTPNTRVWTETGTWADWEGIVKKGSPGATSTFNFEGTGIKIMYIKGSGAGTFSAIIDGGTATTYDANYLSIDVGVVQIIGLNNTTHSITITNTDASRDLYLIGAIPINGNNGVRIDNYSVKGVFAYNSIGSDTLRKVYFKENPQLFIIALTANDFGAQNDIKTYKGYIETAIDDAKSRGMSVLLIANGLRRFVGARVDQIWYTKALYDLADKKDVALIDVNAKWGTYNAALAQGFLVNTDDVHPTDEGHKDISRVVLQYLLN